MIHINFSEPNTKEWRKWRTTCDREQCLHNEAIESGRSSKVKDRVYKGQKNFYINLDGPFHGKCAYCEQKISGDQYGDIEHFRPKARVDDEKTGEPIKIQVDGDTKNHPGYYWLAYDCKNLLPSCILCNQEGKRNFFPVEGFRAVRPGEEEQERPLLIHPVFDNPEDHLEMDELGIFIPKNGSERGKTCIDIFKLNERGLPDERKKIYNTVREKMGLLCFRIVPGGDSEGAKKILNDIENHKNGIEEFTIAARKAIKDSQTACEIIYKI
jgi:hypothetical protein